jgi:hypothetical protein
MAGYRQAYRLDLSQCLDDLVIVAPLNGDRPQSPGGPTDRKGTRRVVRNDLHAPERVIDLSSLTFRYRDLADDQAPLGWVADCVRYFRGLIELAGFRLDPGDRSGNVGDFLGFEQIDRRGCLLGQARVGLRAGDTREVSRAEQ